MKPVEEQTLVERLRIRATIRRNIPGRKSVQEGREDRLANLLDEAADRIEQLEEEINQSQRCYVSKSGN